MPIAAIFFAIFAFSILLNVLYFTLLRGKEEAIFGPLAGIFYFFHGLSLIVVLWVFVIILSRVIMVLVLLGELLWLTFF